MKKGLVLIIVVFLLFLVFAISLNQSNVEQIETMNMVTDEEIVSVIDEPIELIETDERGLLKVHFIDVGQGDSIFLELPNGETMLIDAGEAEYGDNIVTYIFSQGYCVLDYVVATHPHSDHIGGMCEILNNFTVEKFFMTSCSTTTDMFEKMLDMIENNGAKVCEVKNGTVILDEPDLKIETVAPSVLSDNINDTSIMLKLTYGDNQFLFTGDAEKTEEDSIRTNIKCDVLKVGHHGSGTSTSSNFLKKVEPTYAVISCGMNNKYGHPTETVLSRLYDRDIGVFRTDLQGTIVCSSDGKTIKFNKKSVERDLVVPNTFQPTAECSNDEQSEFGSKYVLNTNTMRIHYPDCSSVDQIKDKNKAFSDDFEAAILQGYKPCGICKPAA